jgi:hypothetical protein
MIESWTSEQLESFAREGFLIVEQGFIGPDAIATLRERFDGSLPPTTRRASGRTRSTGWPAAIRRT